MGNGVFFLEQTQRKLFFHYFLNSSFRCLFTRIRIKETSWIWFDTDTAGRSLFEIEIKLVYIATNLLRETSGIMKYRVEQTFFVPSGNVKVFSSH